MSIDTSKQLSNMTSTANMSTTTSTSNMSTTTSTANMSTIDFKNDTSVKSEKGLTTHSKLDSGQWDDVERSFNKTDQLVANMMKDLGKEGMFDSIFKLEYKSIINYYLQIIHMNITYGRLPTLEDKYIDLKNKEKNLNIKNREFNLDNILNDIEDKVSYKTTTVIDSLKKKFNSSKYNKSKKKHKKKLDLDIALDICKNNIDWAIILLKNMGYYNKMSKMDIIKMNTLKTIKTDFLGSDKINTVNYKTNSTFNSQYLEFRIITLMRLMENSISNPDEKRDYELIASMMRIYTELDKIYKNNDNSKKSKTQQEKPAILLDFTIILDVLKNKVNFTFEKLFTKYPRYLFSGEYEKILPKISINPYESQIQLMKYIRENQKALILYRVMIGGGKTVSAGAIASRVNYLKDIEKTSKSNIETRLLFVCSVESVRLQIARMVWNMGIRLAVATKKSSDKVDIIKNYNCYDNKQKRINRRNKTDEQIKELEKKRKEEIEKKIVVILSDIDSAIELLKDSKEKKDKGEKYIEYIVFFDEPTVGSDEENHPITQKVPIILKYSPNKIILSSASLPPENQIPSLIDLYKKNNPDGKIINVNSSDIKIGCEIVSQTEHTIAPHTGVKNYEQLKFVINRIIEQPFIGKIYTAPVLFQLYNSMIKNNIIIPDINKYFENTCNWNQQKIKEFAISLLDCLSKTENNDLIQKICEYHKKISVSDVIEEQNEKQCNDNHENDINISNFNSINQEELVTKYAIKYANGCLIATKDPLGLARKMGESFLSKLPKISEIIKKYKIDMKKYHEEISKIDKSDITQRKSSDNSKGDKIGHENAKDIKSQKIDGLEHPTFGFPDWAQINTSDHVKKFSYINYNNIDNSAIRRHLHLEEIDAELYDIPEWVLLLLYSGIGIYMKPTNTLKSKLYFDKVLNLAEEGKLAFIISDDSINYGANYPFNHVVIFDDMMEHSINTIFQLLGRAGRVGRSYSAFGHIGPLGLEKLLNYINGTEGTGDRKEAINLENACKNMYIREKYQIEKQRIKNEEDEAYNKKWDEFERRRKERQLLYEQKLQKEEDIRIEEEKKKRITMNSFRNRKPYKDNYNKNNKYYSRNNSSVWSRNNRVNNDDYDLEKCKQAINNGKYLSPPLKKLAKQHGLIK